MDKYTVDLDKVLNDFEYKELTEQSNGYAATQPVYGYGGGGGGAAVLAAEPAPYPKLPLPTPATKHSINNVFHSLNEYLNSDIKEAEAGASLPEPEHCEQPIVRPAPAAGTTITQIFKNLTKDSHGAAFQVLDEPQVNAAAARDVINDTSTDAEPAAADIDIEIEAAEVATCTSSTTATASTSTIDHIISTITVNCNNNNINNNNHTQLDECVEPAVVSVVVEEQQHQQEASEVAPVEMQESLGALVDVEQAAVPIVGFEEIADLSDSEMNKELELLEAEYAGQLAADAAPEVDLKSELEEANQRSDAHRPPVAVDDDDRDVNANGDRASDDGAGTPSPPPPPGHAASAVEEEEEEEDEKAEKEAVLEAPPPDVEVRLQSDAACVQAGAGPGLVRPSSLELNSDTGSDNVTIDLIGGPGSTPYNNVYVQDRLLQPDVEAAHSLSPTLSDASTIDNSDSPNTSDSCNDTSLDECCQQRAAPSPAPTPTPTPATAAPDDGDAQTDGGVQAPDAAALRLGQTAPFWIPDSETQSCQHCQQRFTVIRRRHHCRTCGLVLCAACCHQKYPVPYLAGAEARVCVRCLRVLQQSAARGPQAPPPAGGAGAGAHTQGGSSGSANSSPECGGAAPAQPASVLKRTGSAKARHSKSVTFCDGVRPGHDAADNTTTTTTITSSGGGGALTGTVTRARPPPDADHFIPATACMLPPLVVTRSDDRANNNGMNAPPTAAAVVDMMREVEVKFALRKNLFVRARIINMDCCINKRAWCFATEGMVAVGQDELVVLLELGDNERDVPKDIFYHFDQVYREALRGNSVSELGLSVHGEPHFLGSKEHAGFLYIRPTFQCTQRVLLPSEPFLVGLLIHRWETPWAKIFPLRLLLRLGAEYRYYPAPIISTRHRDPVYVEVGHTIINLLADFRNFSYTVPAVRGLTIHMQGQSSTVTLPANRYDQVMKALSNASDHILAFAASFSTRADSHLVCIQDASGGSDGDGAYTTHAINIHNRPREVTGASFIVVNGALKPSSGLAAKSSIVEDGLMVQILPEHMAKLCAALRNMHDFQIRCGRLDAQSDETVAFVWGPNDVHFNVGVTSTIDGCSFSGVPSIRVHNGRDYVGQSGARLIRWTEVFIMQSGEDCPRTQDPVDISKLSEDIAKATAQALVKYLDMLANNSFLKIGIRTTLHADNVSYLAGSSGTRLPPIYMKSLDNELVPVLHHLSTSATGDSAVVLELVFHILKA